MTISEAIEACSYAVLNLSPKTQEWYLQKLHIFAEWCTEQSITLEDLKPLHLQKFTEYLKTRTNLKGKPISSYTIHGYIQVIKGFLKWCTEEDIEIHEKLLKRAPKIKVDTKVIETFTNEQI